MEGSCGEKNYILLKYRMSFLLKTVSKMQNNIYLISECNMDVVKQ